MDKSADNKRSLTCLCINRYDKPAYNKIWIRYSLTLYTLYVDVTAISLANNFRSKVFEKSHRALLNPCFTFYR